MFKIRDLENMPTCSGGRGRDRSRGDVDEDTIARLLRGLPGVSDLASAQSVEPGALSFTLTTRGEADLREALFDTAVDNKLVLLSLSRHAVSLEETFRKLTVAETTLPSTPASPTASV